MSSTENNNAEDAENMEHEEKEEVALHAKSEKGVSRKEIEDLRSEVDKISSDLNTAVTDLKKSVVDIRSAVSEIENPFNLLRVIQSEKDLKKLNSQRLPHGVKSLTLGKPDKKVPEEEKPEEKPSLLEEERLLEPQLEPKPEMEETQPQLQDRLPKGASDYLDWVWSLLDSGLSSDDILQLAKSYEFLGYLPEKSSECIYSLALAAEKMKSIGFKKNHMLLSMYRAASVSGIQIGLGDLNELISMAESKARRSIRTGAPRNK